MGAEIPDGAVIVARAIINSSLWKMRPEDRVVAVTCLAIANKRPKKWFDGKKQITIQRGQFVRSRQEMSQECGLPVQVVRTSLEHLEESEFLTRNLTRAYTLYTLPKYEHYQDLTKYSDYGVLKPTRDPTRLQPGKTSKSNQGFPQVAARNTSENHTVAPLLTNCGNFPTSQNPKTNHKQQHQTKTKPPSDSKGKMKAGEPDGIAVVVPDSKNDPLLEKINVRISMDLLADIKMAESVARAFAATKTVGTVLRAVQQARLQKKPGGWARMALEKGWLLPDAQDPELGAILRRIGVESEFTEMFFRGRSDPPGGKQALPRRRPGEDESAWFRRVNDELKRRKSSPVPIRREKKK